MIRVWVLRNHYDYFNTMRERYNLETSELMQTSLMRNGTIALFFCRTGGRTERRSFAKDVGRTRTRDSVDADGAEPRASRGDGVHVE